MIASCILLTGIVIFFAGICDVSIGYRSNDRYGTGKGPFQGLHLSVKSTTLFDFGSVLLWSERERPGFLVN
jgi:hypothetical protein